MLTIQATPMGGVPTLRLRSKWWINFDYVTSGVTSVVVAVPIALLFAEGPARALGVIYVLAWVALLLPSFFVYGWMIADAGRLFAHGEPTLLRRALLLRAVLMRLGHDITVPAGLSFFAQASMYANPIGNLATTLTIQALRWRAVEVEAMWRTIVEETQSAQVAQLPTHISKSAVMAGPLLERSSPEFACV